MIQLPSAPIEAGRIINIHFSIYSGTDRVRLHFFSKNRINRVLELELNTPITTVECSIEITITITITDKTTTTVTTTRYLLYLIIFLFTLTTL